MKFKPDPSDDMYRSVVVKGNFANSVLDVGIAVGEPGEAVAIEADNGRESVYVFISRKRARKLAKAILKELDR